MPIIVMASCLFDSLDFMGRVFDREVWERAHVIYAASLRRQVSEVFNAYVHKTRKNEPVRIMPARIGQASHQILLEAPSRDVRFYDQGWLSNCVPGYGAI
jgi:hypothetical protein